VDWKNDLGDMKVGNCRLSALKCLPLSNMVSKKPKILETHLKQSRVLRESITYREMSFDVRKSSSVGDGGSEKTFGRSVWPLTTNV